MKTQLHRHPTTQSRTAASFAAPLQAETALSDEDQARIDAALATSGSSNTDRAYRWGWSVWERWTAGRRAQAMPAAPELVAVCIAERAATLAPASLRLLRTAVAARHQAAGLDDPTAHAVVRHVLAGVTRSRQVEGLGQVDGISWQEADRVATLASDRDGSPAGLRDATLIRAMSDALLRVSEASNLNVEDLSLGEDRSGTILVRRSKTDREGTGTALYLGPPTMDVLQRYLEACAVTSGPLFRRINKGGAAGERLSAPGIRAVIQRRAAAAGIEGRVSGHSLRVGSAKSLAAAGAGLVALQVAGRWKSPTMPAHYARRQLAATGAVAKLLYGATDHPTSDR